MKNNRKIFPFIVIYVFLFSCSIININKGQSAIAQLSQNNNFVYPKSDTNNDKCIGNKYVQLKMVNDESKDNSSSSSICSYTLEINNITSTDQLFVMLDYYEFDTHNNYVDSGWTVYGEVHPGEESDYPSSITTDKKGVKGFEIRGLVAIINTPECDYIQSNNDILNKNEIKINNKCYIK